MLTKEILENISSNERVMQAGESVMIGKPKAYPVDMVEELKRVFKNIECIRCAYLLWMVRNDERSFFRYGFASFQIWARRSRKSKTILCIWKIRLRDKNAVCFALLNKKENWNLNARMILKILASLE